MTKQKKILCLLIFFIAATILFAYAAMRQNEKPVTGTSFMMDTVVEYKLYGKGAQAAKTAIERELSDIENRMSIYIDSSEISLLNQKAGTDFTPLSEDTFALLARCVGFGNMSEGIFDITVAPLTKEWNITAVPPKVPDKQVLSDLLPLVNYHDILLDGERFSAMLAHKGQAVDLGGVAKGYACEAARRAAIENGITSGYISIGGNLMVIGSKPNGEPFKFGVRDPRGGPNEYVAVVTLPDSTMATSGDYERYFEQDGIRYHHILDPGTGYPAQTDVMSVSVVSPDGAYADFMSTYLFIRGKAFILDHLNELGCGLIVIDKDKNIYVSQDLKDQVALAGNGGNYNLVQEQ